MMKWFLLLLSIFSFIGCDHPKVEKPLRTDSVSSTSFQKLEFRFNSKHKNWSAHLLTFTQPIPLKVQYIKDGFIIKGNSHKGMIEGDAQICLSQNHQYFYYPIRVYNEKINTLNPKDYRSPKTNNTDSNLYQQSIIHNINSYRNIDTIENKSTYFLEKKFQLPPVEKTYRSIANEPMTSYYVQTGSCTNLSISYQYLSDKNCFNITTNILKDKYGNIISNGTLVQLHIVKSEKKYQIESYVQKGIASISIPSNLFTDALVSAKINQINSKTITLTSYHKTCEKIDPISTKSKSISTAAKRISATKISVISNPIHKMDSLPKNIHTNSMEIID